MKKVYDKTKNKIQELWNAVSDILGSIEELTARIDTLQNSTDGAWKELNRPKTVPPNAKFIDIAHHYLVELDDEGAVVEDGNGNPKMSPLYAADNSKTSVVWDETAKCFRFYAVYAPGV